MSPEALAVDQDSGDVYAVDVGGNSVHRFTAAGAPSNFSAGPDAGTNTLTGFNFETGFAVNQVAVDNSGGDGDGNVYVTDTLTGTVEVFSSSGAALGTLNGLGNPDGSFPVEPCGVAVDQSNGDLYVAAYGNRVYRYSPVGTIDEADYSGGIATTFNPCQIAADSGNVYVVPWNADPFSTGPAHRFAGSAFAMGPPPSPASTTIGTTALGLYVDPSTGDLYLNEIMQVAVFDSAGAPVYSFGSGEFTAAGVAVKADGPAYLGDIGAVEIDRFSAPIASQQLTVTKPGVGSGTVTSDPAGIDCGPTCVADFNDGTVVTLTATPAAGSAFKQWSGCDSVAGDECTVTLDANTEIVATFTTSPAISATQSDQVGATSARLKAQLNPGGEQTTYHFEYGDQGPCDANPCTSTPDQSAGPGHTPVAVARPISGLDPATTYHFRLVATNDLGTTEGPSTTLTTHAATPTFDPCPNDQFRTGLSAKLPDCRAYEQATPVGKNGGDVQGSTQHVRASRAGDAVTFFSSGTPGGSGSQDFPSYVARRGDASWATRGLLPPPSFGTTAFVRGWTQDLAYALVGGAFPESNEGALFSRSTSDGSMQAITPYTLDLDSGRPQLVGASADNSKLLIDVRGPALAPGAVPGESNLYVFDRETGVFTLAGVLPESACASPPCIPAGGSFGGSYDWYDVLTTGGPLEVGGTEAFYVTENQHAVSADGDVFFTAADTGQIYFRKDAAGPGATTDQVNASQAAVPDPNGTQTAIFQTATPDGAHAFFTSSEELTDDANTGPDAGIGRANLDGTDLDSDFIPANALAVEVHGSHIFWASANSDTIGRANLDGSGADPDFITGADNPRGVAVEGTHIYWTNAADQAAGTGTIGRAELDVNGDLVPGTVNQSFVAGAHNPQGIDVGGGFIFWINFTDTEGFNFGGVVARADIDGSDVNQALINGGATADVAVDGTHVYYSRRNDAGACFIRRALHDGTNVQNVGTNDIGACGSPSIPGPSIAINGSHIYAANALTGVIRRANLDGTGFVDAATLPFPRGFAITASHLYWSAPTSGEPGGNDLYRYDTASDELVDLTPLDSETNGARVVGVLGASDDGERVYFAANGVLAPGALPGDCPQAGSGFSGACSLYLSDDGDIRFIARLAPANTIDSDSDNWRWTIKETTEFEVRTARVSADGGTLLFRSREQLTGYDNQGVPQFYRYDAAGDELACISCNPTGAAPESTPALQSILPTVSLSAAPAQMKGWDTRNMSSDGDRVFFETADALVSADTNGLKDVYEWEAEGAGSCQAPNADGGCLYLLSSGTSSSPSRFADASVDGDHAFFFTRDRLVPQDRDDLQDVYVARAGGGLSGQHEVESQDCSGDACQGEPGPTPAVPTAGSLTFTGAGNVVGGLRSPATRVTLRRLRPLTGSVARLRVRVSSAGIVSVVGKRVRNTNRFAGKGRTLTLKVALKAKDRKRLRKNRRVRVQVKLTFRPQAGRSVSRALSLTFKTKKTKKKVANRGRSASTTGRAGL